MLFKAAVLSTLLSVGAEACTSQDENNLVRAIRSADKTAIVGARLFDLFERDGVRSMAVEVTLQPGEKSFTDEELKAVADKIVAAAAKLGAVLRG